MLHINHISFLKKQKKEKQTKNSDKGNIKNEKRYNDQYLSCIQINNTENGINL